MDAPSSFCSVLEGRCPHAPPPHPLSAAVQICKWICPGGRAGWARINSPLSLQGEGDALASMSPFLSPLINQKGRPAGRGGQGKDEELEASACRGRWFEAFHSVFKSVPARLLRRDRSGTGKGNFAPAHSSGGGRRAPRSSGQA